MPFILKERYGVAYRAPVRSGSGYGGNHRMIRVVIVKGWPNPRAWGWRVGYRG